jgi:hypothetical protein
MFSSFTGDFWAEEERSNLRPKCTRPGVALKGVVPKRREIFCRNAPAEMYPNASPKSLSEILYEGLVIEFRWFGD